MDYSMRMVQKHCAKYLEMFAQCMHEYPHTWQADCERERAKLAICAETNPEILHIKTSCHREFQVYEQCMESNPTRPDKCTFQFEKFTVCADKALESIQPQGSQTSSDSKTTDSENTAARVWPPAS